MTHERNIESSPYSFTGQRMHMAYQKAAAKDPSALPPASDEEGRLLSQEEYEERFLQDADYLRISELLPASLLKRHLMELQRNRKKNRIKYEFRHGTTLTLAVISTNDIGMDLTENEIRNGNYLVPMTVEKNDATDSVLCLRTGPFVQVLPDKIRSECSMQIAYENELDREITDTDFAQIYNFHINAFNAWRRFFGLDELEDIPHI